jgi:TctA family transporter
MKNGLDWSNGINKAQAVFTICTMIICGVAPVGMTFFFTIRIQQFRDKVFLSRFGSIIGDFNFREKMSSLFISIFCYRRLIEVLLIVFVASYPYAQVQLMTLSCVFAVILFGYSNAYRMSGNR